MAGKDGSVGRSHLLPTTSRLGGGWTQGQLSPSSQTVVNQPIVIHVADKFIGKKTQSTRRRIRINGQGWEGLGLCSCSWCSGTRGALSILPTPLHTITSAQSMEKTPSPGDSPPPAQLHPRGLIQLPGTAANTIEQILVLLLHRDEQAPGCSRKTWNLG